ncbi:MAG: Uma2 family endonuclease [Pseudanabaenales cyanobacterium]|nr:Uma2 family endonuclease [Pseudanabaenales cyanobacterium]
MTQSKPRLIAKDLEKVQVAFPDYQMELAGGKIIVMSPCGIEPDEVALEIGAQLRNWVKPRRLGRVTGSSGGYKPVTASNPDGDVSAPNVVFIRADRMIHTTQDYAELAPDLMFEVKSKTSTLEELREKNHQFLVRGTQVGVLVDPRTSTLEVYREDQDKIILTDGDILTLPDLLPGWRMEVSSIWAPDFEDKPDGQ